ncbi:MAG: S-layer homology domain-containing protein [bacterium]
MLRKILVLFLAAAILFSFPLSLWAEEEPPPFPDMEPPHSQIISPQNGVTLTSNPIIITGTATDNEWVQKVELEIVLSGSPTTTYLCTPGSGGDYSNWSFTWVNPTPGTYILTSIATDRLGNQEENPQSISITVSSQITPVSDTYPPPLVILFPPVSEYPTTDQELTIEGQTEVGATVTINGQSVPVEELGYFSYKVALSPGENSFLIEARDLAGNKTSAQLVVNYSGTEQPPTPTPTPTSSPTPGPFTFPDLDGHWAQDLISTLLEKGIISGYPDGTFKPDQPITRAEFSAILCRALGISPSESGSNFPDLQGHWAEKYVTPLVEKGFIKGYPDGTFGPDQLIKRSEIAAIMARAMTLPPLIGKPTFSDIDTTHWAFGFVEAAASKGLIKGYPNGTFRPENSATRAEACAIVARSQGF